MCRVTAKELFVLLALSILFLPWGCRTAQTELSGAPVMAETFPYGYNEVWTTLEEVIVEEMMLPIKTKDKTRGMIETDWISVIRLRGILRWHVKVFLDGDEQSTAVRLYVRVEEPSSEKDAVGKMKTKKGEIKTGWTLSNEEIPEAHDLLHTLSRKLGN